MRLLVLVLSILVCCRAATITAQNQTATVRVHVNAAGKPVEGIEVVVAGTTYRTDSTGTTTIVTVPGSVDITVLKPGFAPATATVQVAAGATQDVVVEVQPQPSLKETVTVVRNAGTPRLRTSQSFRNYRRFITGGRIVE